MEHDRPHEQMPAAPDQGGQPEMEPQLEVERLPEALGFNETPALQEVRGQLVEAMAEDSEAVPELATHYHHLAEKVISEIHAKAQIGLIIQMGLIRREAGRTEGYQEALQDALLYADNMGLEDMVPILEREIEAEGA